jgi:ankyrin repeat protein
MSELLEEGAPISMQDHGTALHYVAAYGARAALRVLLKSGECNYLVRDRKGRLPSQLAREFGHDDAMARLLIIKEMRQAQAEGIDPVSLYRRSRPEVAPTTQP